MYTLAIGSTIAVLSAWITAPTGGVFDSGITGRFAAALEQSSNDCLAADLIVDGGDMIAVINEHGDVIEVDLGAMPLIAAHQLRSVMPGQFVAAATPITPDALICSAMATTEEHEVTVEVEVFDGQGTVVVHGSGEEREFEIDLDNLEDVPFGEMTIEMGAEGVDLGDVFQKLMRGDVRSEARADVVVVLEDGDGERQERRINLLGEDTDLGELMMMFTANDHAAGEWRGNHHGNQHAGRGMGQCPHCGPGSARKGSHGRPEMGHGGGGHADMSHRMGHPGMNNRMDEGMMRQHMRFLDEMREDPHAVWEMIDGLPGDMREQHEVIMHALMRGGNPHGDHGDHNRDGFNREAESFAEKIDMTNRVAKRLGDGEAMAIFGVWQARERMGPNERIEMLGPMIGDQSLMLSVRNAAAWVVMDAQNELDNRAGSAETLRRFIMTNGVN